MRYPAGMTCGDFSAARTQVARDILTCNQDNWRENCLAHYADNLEYTDGPGLTHIAGKDQMSRYLRNQFEFSRQYLTVAEETCAADTYVATWSLDMDLGTGNLRGMPGISVLKFKEAAVGTAGGGGGGGGGGDGIAAAASGVAGGVGVGGVEADGTAAVTTTTTAAAAAGTGGLEEGLSGEEVDALGDGGTREDPNLVRFHRDYLPDGKIWENAPIVGPLVKFQRETYMGCMLSQRGCADLLGAPK